MKTPAYITREANNACLHAAHLLAHARLEMGEAAWNAWIVRLGVDPAGAARLERLGRLRVELPQHADRLGSLTAGDLAVRDTLFLAMSDEEVVELLDGQEVRGLRWSELDLMLGSELAAKLGVTEVRPTAARAVVEGSEFDALKS